MEKIFVFIIIMIISSLISKNKKKKAEENFRSTRPVQNTGKRTGYDPKQPAAPVNDLKSLLNSLKNFEQNKVQEPEPATYDVQYNTASEHEETHYTETERSHDETNRSKVRDYETSYDELHNPEKSSAAKEKSRLDTEFYQKHERDTAPKMTIRNELFNTRIKLRNAIIVSEILKRKYT